MTTSDSTRVGAAPDPRAERYRRAERAFWESYGLAPAAPAPTSPHCCASWAASAAWSSTGPAGA